MPIPFPALLMLQVPPLPPVVNGPQIPFEAVIIAKSFFTSIVFIALGIPIIRSLSRRFLERPAAPSALPHDLVERLERIEQAVDAIAIEVERVSEGQRYTTKLLAEVRPLLPGAPDAPRR